MRRSLFVIEIREVSELIFLRPLLYFYDSILKSVRASNAYPAVLVSEKRSYFGYNLYQNHTVVGDSSMK